MATITLTSINAKQYINNAKQVLNKVKSMTISFAIKALDGYFCLLCSKVEVPGLQSANRYMTWLIRLIVALPMLILLYIVLAWLFDKWMLLVRFINFVRWGI